ncbi:MAG: PspC domain-containing protein [Armatimonadota bacterium]
MRLHRSTRDVMLGGVLGGFAETYGWDAGLVRVLFVLALLLTGFFPLGIAYLIMWAILPKETMAPTVMR